MEGAVNLAGAFEAEAIADAGMKITTTATSYVATALPLAQAYVEGTGSMSALYQLARSYMPSASSMIIGQMAQAAIGYAKKKSKSGETASASARSNVRKTGRREELAASYLDVIERPLRMKMSTKGDSIKSVWSSLRDLVSGKKRLVNSFAFKVRSTTDQRAVMAIPLRHDGNFAFQDNPTDTDPTHRWTIGAQAAVNHAVGTGAGGDGYGAYDTMLQTPPLNLGTSGGVFVDTSSVIIPRLNLPTLEQTSWDLNALKLNPQDNLMRHASNSDNTMQYNTIVQPVTQLGGTAVPYKHNATENALLNGYPEPGDSYARKQDLWVESGDPYEGILSQMPRFKTQLGGGSLKMRMCNQGLNMSTVEIVVLKVVNPYVADAQLYPGANQLVAKGANGCNMTRLWRNLYNTVGYEHRRKVTSSLSYSMGDTDPDVHTLQRDPIWNPYKPWLPQSCFKSKYYIDDDRTTEALPGLGTTNATTVGTVPTPGKNSYLNNPLGIMNPTGPNPVESPAESNGGAGQTMPYRVHARGHCTIAASAERTLTIVLPSSVYDASRIQAGNTGNKATYIQDNATVAPVSDQTYIVCISVNGSLQDIIEPQVQVPIATPPVSTGNVRVIGKAYTGSVVDFHCTYAENIHPSVCDYSSVTSTKYNLGVVRGPQVPASSDLSFAGKVMDMSKAVSVVNSGVLRVGGEARAAPNEGGTI